jgi:D-alanyl-lipoteichoic acid acyltransferase DltB (MBOAT superfamily)
MQFNSIDFAIFLPIVFAIYWSLSGKIKLQNVLILLASYVFYGWWDWKFLSLIIISTCIDYFVGLYLHKEENQVKRKYLLWISILANIGFLGFFKYFNFFSENFVQAFSFFGYEISSSSLNIVLPVGISFYTFQTLSYTIDVYRKKLNPTKDMVAFAAYVSFFPQLVAGPIERAINLLPQFHRKRTFVYSEAVDGMRQILWGLFKKVVIADNCAEFVNLIFSNYDTSSGSTLAVGAVFFTIQIYCDFSGYSDIAIGVSRLFGFKLMQNFNFPFFSRDIAEFWRRWHISLSTWFRDYLYIPLGGSRGTKFKVVRNTFIIFIVSGFWHGANWTFIMWGLINALYFLPLLLSKRNRRNLDTIAQHSLFPNIREFMSMLFTFGITVLAFIFFRADSVGQGLEIISGILDKSLFSFPMIKKMDNFLILLSMIALLFIQEWFGRFDKHALEKSIFSLVRPLRWIYYLLLFSAVFLLGGQEQEFIYFQF